MVRAKARKSATIALLSMMQGMIKQRQESSKIYKDANRPELAATEDGEIAAIMKFLPQQMDDSGIEQTVVKLLADLNVTEAKDMGKVMAALKTDYAGQLDMGQGSALVKKKLAG